MKVYQVEAMIYRQKLRDNPNVLYVFGDNDIRKGLGGQAKEMRGEPNAIGISTKKLPNNEDNAFKTDEEFDENCRIINEDIGKVIKAMASGQYKSLVIPVLGVGMAKLPEKAPKTYEYLKNNLAILSYIGKHYL